MGIQSLEIYQRNKINVFLKMSHNKVKLQKYNVVTNVLSLLKYPAS